MLDTRSVTEIAETDLIQSLDISMFSQQDILNAVLQRSEVLFDLRRPGIPIRQWSKGNPVPLQQEVEKRGPLLLRRAIAYLFLEFQTLKPSLDSLKFKQMADIGCGYGFVDLFIAREYDASLTLIDLEDNGETHFGFSTQGAAYSSLRTAKKFLMANGLSAQRVRTLNPGSEDPNSVKNMDLAISLISCGFHYPVSTYAKFWETSVKPEGAIILDLRETRSTAQEQELGVLGEVRTIWESDKRKRVLVQKSKS